MSSEYNDLYKQAFLEGLAGKAGLLVGKAGNMLNKFKSSYVMKAVRDARPQYAAAEEPMTIHGTVLKALDENGAFGASHIRKGLDKVRRFAEDVDTGLGAIAMGKHNVENMANPAVKSWRKTLFVSEKHNLIKNPTKVPGVNPYGDDLNTFNQARRSSISEPIAGVGRMAVPVLALGKGMEILHGASQPSQLNEPYTDINYTNNYTNYSQGG